jgi:hypothetical protein
MSTPNTLTGLIPTIYTSLDIVARELVGAITAVNINGSLERVAKDETITVPITPKASLEAIIPGIYPPDTGQQTITYTSFTLDKAYEAPILWNGEQQQSIMNQNDWAANGRLMDLIQKQMVQAMRALTNQIESDVCAQAAYMSRATGTPGTTPFATSMASVAQCRKILNKNGAPQTVGAGDRSLIVDCEAAANYRTLGNFVLNYAAGTTDTLRNGTLLPVSGFDIKESAQIAAHTAGSGSLYVVDCTVSLPIGTTDIVTKTGSGTILAGDYVTFGSDPNKYMVTSGITAAAQTLSIAKPGLVNAVLDDATITNETVNSTLNFFLQRDALQLVVRAPIMPVVPLGGSDGDISAFVKEVQDPVSGLVFQVALYKLYREVKFEVGAVWNSSGLIKPEFTGVLLG